MPIYIPNIPVSGFYAQSVETRMTDKVTLAATVLKEHRQSIDRLDAILIYTLGRTFQAHPSRGHIEGRA